MGTLDHITRFKFLPGLVRRPKLWSCKPSSRKETIKEKVLVLRDASRGEGGLDLMTFVGFCITRGERGQKSQFSYYLIKICN
jgi:hypothetical protein